MPKRSISRQLSFEVILPEDDNDLGRLQKKLATARSALAGYGRELAEIDQQLAPVRKREASLKAALAQTYVRTPSGVVMPNPEGRDAREPLFEALTDLSEQFGYLRNERRKLSSCVKAYLKDISQIARRIDKLQEEAKS